MQKLAKTNTSAPRVQVVLDKERDTTQFIKYLAHPRFPQHQQNILAAYPDLGQILTNAADDQEYVMSAFVREEYSAHSKDVERIVAEAEESIANVVLPCLKALAELMQYTWPDNREFTAIPTLLPFSPFEGDIFYFSILAELRGRNKVNFPFVAIHEISHQLLYDELANLYGRPAREELGWLLLHYLQEILAPVLMNQEPIRTLAHVTEYYGNPNLQHIYVSPSEIQISEYFRQRYDAAHKRAGYTFLGYIKDVVTTLRAIEMDLAEHQEMWNKHGASLYKDQSLLAVYRRPITNAALV